jgi:hypothetical protein
MYASLSQFKDYIWICQADTSKDVELQLMLDSAWDQINKLCGVDSFLSNTYEEDIDIRKIYTNTFWYNIFLKNKPVSAIIEINGEAYTWAKWVDYMVSYDRRVIFKSFNYNAWFGFVHVKYIAWYDYINLPDDLKLMEMMLACGRYQQKWMVWVSSYKLWDEQIVFWGRNEETADDMYFSFRYMLDKFKNFNLAI